MNRETAPPADDLNGQIAALVHTLHETEQRLQELTQGQVDAVVLPAGHSYLLGEAQEKLRHSERAQREAADIQSAILDALPAHIALIDSLGLIISVNESWRHFATANVLQGPEFFVGQNYLAICERATGDCGAQAQAAAEGIRRVLRGEAKNFEIEYPCHSPTERQWFQLVVTPVCAEGRAGAVVMHFNITKRKEIESELVRANRALQMLSSGNERLIRAENEQQLLDDICRMAVEIGGYRMAWVGYAQDDEYRTIKPMAHAGHEAGYFTDIKISWSETNPFGRGPAGRTIRSGQPTVSENISDEAVSPDWHVAVQRRGYRGIVCLPLREGGHTFGLLGLYSSEVNHLDAAELKLLQELADDLAFGIGNLRARAERQRVNAKVREQAALLDAASDAIILKDLDGRILFWSRGAEQLYGWTAAEVVGQKSCEFLFPDVAKFRESLQAVVQKNHLREEVQQHTKNWRLINVDMHWTLVPDQDGKPKSILAINTDITERKKLEAQFLRVQRMENIGTLASGVAHDLNNILAPITMSIELLRDKVNDDEGRGLLDTLETSSQRGVELVKQVLSVARGVEGQRTLVNPAHLIREIQKIIHETFPKNIQFSFNAPGDVWLVNADPTQLHQIFMNLCVNARDAMPEGGKLIITIENVVLDEVYAGMNPEAKQGAHVAIKIEDTGTGIPPAILEKIFEPFFTTKEIGKGTGLGLSTTQAIIKSHQGFVNVYSEQGKGSIFKIYLPAETTAKEMEKAVVEKSQLPRGKGELVLVVDDEEAIRIAARKTLERFGYRVLLAANGAEAVATYARHGDEIAVVLTDMAMPVMDGPATIIALKVMNPQVKIIGSSGHASNGGVAKAVGAGIKHFIPKPYTAEAMLKILAEVV